MEEPILASAASFEDPLLRSLDAIHLATAVTLGVPGLVLVTYDKRLAAAAQQAALAVATPS
jgi:hypothetical protein